MTATSSLPRMPWRTESTVAVVLLAAAMAGWWWSVGMAAGMGSSTSRSLLAYLAGWVAMMAAMMLPAVWPVTRLYARAAARGAVAPVPFFVVGYLTVWAASGIPAYYAWRMLSAALASGQGWAARLAGVTLLAAAGYQLSPLKTRCLSYCRSPLSFFLRPRNRSAVRAALQAGAGHGLFCLGCCWALMAVLVAVGTMNLAWMGALSAVVHAEKLAPRGHAVAAALSPALATVGALLVIHPPLLSTLT